MKTTPASIEQIIEDLRDRAGLGDEWDGMDPDIQEEIKKKWIKILEE